MPTPLPSIILVTNKSNIRYLCGFSGTSGFLVMREKKGFLFTDARYHLVAKKVLPKGFGLIDVTGGLEKGWKKFLVKQRVKKIGMESGALTLQKWKYFKKISPGVAWVDVGESLSERRIVKAKNEIACLTKAQKITDEIFDRLKKWIKADMSEKEIAWKVMALAHELGADDISFPPIIGFGANSASPHHKSSDKRLKKGNLILIDMGVIYKGYCSDMTRMLFTKAPTSEQKKVYELVRTAQETAINKLRAGVTGSAGDEFARSVIKKWGYGKFFGHSLGHGVGLDIHELPNLSSHYTKKIQKDAVVTVEPGIYLAGKFGVRLEDMVLVKENGVINLTKSAKSIQESLIRLQ